MHPVTVSRLLKVYREWVAGGSPGDQGLDVVDRGCLAEGAQKGKGRPSTRLARILEPDWAQAMERAL